MKKGFFYLNLSAGVFVILFCIYGYDLHRQRLSLPPEIDQNFVVRIDGTEIIHRKDIEFIVGNKSIEDSVSVEIDRHGKRETFEISLVPYYSRVPIPLIYLSIGLFILFIGMIVFILRPNDRKARVYYWASLTFSYSLTVGSGFYLARKGWPSFIPGALFFICYPLAAALLLHFSFQFTPGRWRIQRFLSFLIVYTPAFLFAVSMVALYFLAILSNSIETYRFYLKMLTVLRIYLILYVCFAVGHLIHLFKRIFLQEQRAQIKWALFGLTLGLSPFIILYQLPLVLGWSPLISEELSNIFFILIPVAFFFSIVKYRLMNIELVINRSLVYGLLTIFTVSIYLFSVHLLQTYVADWLAVEDVVLSGLAALVAASTFHPARKKIQEFVDKAFYRLSYDYKKCLLSFMERAQKMVSPDQLIDFFILSIHKTLPLERLGVIILSKKTDPPTILFQRDWMDEMNILIDESTAGSRIFSRKPSVRTEEGIDFSHESILEEQNIEAVIPLIFQATNYGGYLILGKKKSGERYSYEDIELLLTLSQELTVSLERIQLQEEVIVEKAEKEKLNELNRLKTAFVSSVSHEIRTPMGSIQSLSELLKEGRVEDPAKQKELLSLIVSECTRLSRFIHNILDFGKIETQTKQYSFSQKDLKTLVEETMKLFAPRFESEGFVIRTHFPPLPVTLNIDSDAVKQALTNLLDNAIKYSRDQKEIDVSIVIREAETEIQIKDRGIGIHGEEQDKIFQNFYRSSRAAQQFPSGVGLGLKIVKHIMDAHEGKIKVVSQQGKGSTFSLVFAKS